MSITVLSANLALFLVQIKKKVNAMSILKKTKDKKRNDEYGIKLKVAPQFL